MTSLHTLLVISVVALTVFIDFHVHVQIERIGTLLSMRDDIDPVPADYAAIWKRWPIWLVILCGLLHLLATLGSH